MSARLATALAAALLLCGCGDVRHDLRGEEPQILAWWFEDVAHGIPRRPEELRLVDGSERMERIADWAEGSSIRGVREPPRPIKARCSRLALLSTILSQGQAVVVPESGLIAPRPGLSRDDAELVDPVVDAENQDRRMLDAVVISMAQAHDAEAEAYLQAVRAARVELDQRAGGTLWAPAKK